MVRCLLTEAQVHKRYWPEIICAVTYLPNRILANTIEMKTSFEIFFKRNKKQSSKWDEKADMKDTASY